MIAVFTHHRGQKEDRKWTESGQKADRKRTERGQKADRKRTERGIDKAKDERDKVKENNEDKQTKATSLFSSRVVFPPGQLNITHECQFWATAPETINWAIWAF